MNFLSKLFCRLGWHDWEHRSYRNSIKRGIPGGSVSEQAYSSYSECLQCHKRKGYRANA